VSSGQQSLDEAARALLTESVAGIIAIYRFGSSVTGDFRPDSDIDLAVLADGRLDPHVRFDLQDRLSAALRRPVDLVDLRGASTVMASQVVTHGVVVYDGDPIRRGAFEDYVYGAYARLNEERRGILERVAAEGTVYGR
jgi:predicted nucleotidyltransferase